MFSAHIALCSRCICVSLCLSIFPFSLTQMGLCYAQCCLFSLGNVSVIVPFQYILLNGSIIWKYSPASPSSRVPSCSLPVTLTSAVASSQALWGVSNTQQVPGPVGFVEMTAPFSLTLPSSRTSRGYWSLMLGALESRLLLLLAGWPQASPLTLPSLSFLDRAEDGHSSPGGCQLRGWRHRSFQEEKVGWALGLWPPAFG